MSLIVAMTHPDGTMTMVSDTKVTWEDDAARTRSTYVQALPKIVILRHDVMVGVAGSDPHGAIERVVSQRDKSLTVLFQELASLDNSFLVATSQQSRLWVIKNGSVTEVPRGVRAWVGDHAGFEVFQQKYSEWPAHASQGTLRMLSSMQWLTSFDVVESVGGYSLLAGTASDGFRFQGLEGLIEPWYMESIPSSDENGREVLIPTVPIGADPTRVHFYVLPGDAPTPGALGLYVKQSGVGIIFCQDRPWVAHRLPATNVGELIERAHADLGQTLSSQGEVE